MNNYKLYGAIYGTSMTKQAAPGRMFMSLARRATNGITKSRGTARNATKLLTGAPVRQIGMNMGNATANIAANAKNRSNFWNNLGRTAVVGTAAYGAYKLREKLNNVFGGGTQKPAEAPVQTTPSVPSQPPQSQLPQSRPAVPGHPDAVWTPDGSGYEYKGKNTVTDPWYKHYR